ncbi:MAG: homoserine dehydrogenase [Planctomycetota bacterium]|nr:homoserine dehydrogenase [Planctomycetota bacterium]
MSESKPLQVGIIGMGTVGTGVARILVQHVDRIRRRVGRDVQLKRATVRDLDKPRDVELPPGVLTDDIDAVIDDPDIDVAVQLIGGTDPARDIMKRLLAAGKHVVTANKALLCEFGDELFEFARKHDRTIAFEAAVAGGIPIIATVGQSMSANQITSIEAILNGTSNYILTEMLKRGSAYSDVLGDAQRLGYAEADPAMDVDGTDAAQKLVILAQLAFGTKVPLDRFPRSGIDQLELTDLTCAAELNYVVKLLATARLVHGELEMHVQPTLVKCDRLIAKTDGPFNMIALEGDAVGKTWLSGPGAGQMATASAVVADVVDLAVGRAQVTFSRLDLWNDHPPVPLCEEDKIAHRFYLRFNVEDRPHVFADIADILGRHDISLASIIQHESSEQQPTSNGASIVPVVVMTHYTAQGKLRAAEAELSQLTSLHPPIVRMPVSD